MGFYYFHLYVYHAKVSLGKKLYNLCWPARNVTLVLLQRDEYFCYQKFSKKDKDWRDLKTELPSFHGYSITFFTSRMWLAGLTRVGHAQFQPAWPSSGIKEMKTWMVPNLMPVKNTTALQIVCGRWMCMMCEVIWENKAQIVTPTCMIKEKSTQTCLRG